MSKKLLFVFAIFCIFICGCGKDEKQIVLRMTSWGNDVEERSIREHIERFEEAHSNIRVELEITPWARMMDKLMISTAGGRPPDVTRISSEWFVPLADKGILHPLDEYVKRDNFNLDDFYEEALDGWGRYKGVLYELPTDIDIYALYYNKTMFDELELPYPDETWDWNKYIEICKKITADTNGDGKLDRWGASLDLQWQSYIYQNGGRTISEDGKTCLINTDEAIGGLQYMTDMINKYHIAPSNEEAANLNNGKLFANKKIASFVGGSWAGDLWFSETVKGFEYDAAVIPKGPKGRQTYLAGAAYAIVSRSRHKDEAWELVKWMTSGDFQKKAALRNQIIPARKSVADVYLTINRPPHNKQAFLDSIPNGWTQSHVPSAPEMTTILNSMAEKIRLGMTTVKSNCEETAPVINQLLRNEN